MFALQRLDLAAEISPAWPLAAVTIRAQASIPGLENGVPVERRMGVGKNVKTTALVRGVDGKGAVLR